MGSLLAKSESCGSSERTDWREEAKELHGSGSEICLPQFTAPYRMFRSSVLLLLAVTVRGRKRGQEEMGNNHKRKSSHYVFRGLGRYIKRKIVE